MKIVRENINFERGSEDPFRSLDIGQYAKIRKELEEDPHITISKSIETLEELAAHISLKPLRLLGHLNQSLKRFRKDGFWTEKIDFLKDMIIDIARKGGKISEKDYIDWVIKYTEDIDFDPLTLVNVIDGVFYDIQMT